MSDTQSTVSPPKDVLVYVPGIGQAESMGAEHVSQLICWELDQQAPDRRTKFAVAPASVDAQVIHRIERTDGSGKTVGVLDIYSYDAVADLDKTASTGNALRRAISLGLVAISGFLVLVGVWVSVWRRGKTRPQLLQAIILLLMVVLIFIYFAIAVFALVQAGIAVVRGESDAPAVRWPQWVVLIGAVAGAFIPGFRERITWLGERAVQMARFTLTGTARNQMGGSLQDLVDRIAHRPEVERVHVVGYSFGSLVALEAIYPQGGRPGPAIALVDTIVTIGCPFDLVRMVRPSYTEGRTLVDEVRPRWINIYQPIDVLGSNFRNDKDVAVATNGLVSLKNHDENSTAATSNPVEEKRLPEANLAWNPDLKLNAINFFALRSLSIHTDYWGESTTARSAWGLVVAQIAARRAILSAPAASEDATNR